MKIRTYSNNNPHLPALKTVFTVVLLMFPLIGLVNSKDVPDWDTFDSSKIAEEHISHCLEVNLDNTSRVQLEYFHVKLKYYWLWQSDTTHPWEPEKKGLQGRVTGMQKGTRFTQYSHVSVRPLQVMYMCVCQCCLCCLYWLYSWCVHLDETNPYSNKEEKEELHKKTTMTIVSP